MSLKLLLDEYVRDNFIAGWGYSEKDEAQTFDSFEQWLKEGLHGDLSYLSGERGKKREALSAFFPEFQSSLVFLFSYANVAKFLEGFYQSPNSNGLKMASYLFGFNGEDYHSYLKQKLNRIAQEIKSKHSSIEFTLSLDVHPVLERDLAVRSGLGWFGKNSMFINIQEGSFIILGSLFFSEKLSLENKIAVADHCGTCQTCIDACPTDAILNNRTLDANKCISNFTIERFKDCPAPDGMENANGEIFGCDICQDVCPWNKKKLKVLDASEVNISQNLSQFLTMPSHELILMLEKMSNREFRRVFKNTPLERTGRIGMLKNLRFWQK